MSIGKHRNIPARDQRIEIGGRVEEYRKILGLGKVEFAKLLEKNPADYNKYLDARLDPQGLFLALRKAGCDLNWLVDGSGSPPKPVLGESILEYESEEMREEVEAESDRIAKIVQLSSPGITPVQARDLREALKKWVIKRYLTEHEGTRKSVKREKG
ncbi:MAG TPA: hypothetical protein VLX91_01920 [Candidatus Acidoferrales bacterium]|nr:hypothetical protein [Candidatus Acidoferrales bacterium]